LVASEYVGLSMPANNILLPIAQPGQTYLTLNMGDNTDANDEMDETEATAAGTIYVSGTYITSD
jgi:hypothetical protein